MVISFALDSGVSSRWKFASTAAPGFAPEMEIRYRLGASRYCKGRANK